MFESNIKFYAGEKKYIDVTVVPKNKNDTVVVSAASYELLRGAETVEEGRCEAEGEKLKLLLGIDEGGVYVLKITAQIGEEVFIQKASVFVEGN